MASNPLILGHRGSSAISPENTLAAFSQALSDGADGIEFDVRLSRDGVPVVIHDATLKRTGSIDRLVSELSAAELQEFDVGSWFAASGKSTKTFSREKLPTLAQVFELFAGKSGVLYIEMKCDAHEGAALAAAVVARCRESRMTKRVVVESFDLAAIREVKKIDSAIRTAALFEPKLSRPISTIRPLKTIAVAVNAGANEIALHHTLAAPRVIEKARREGLEVVVWTVDEAAWISRARSLGVKALIANNPAMMVRVRNE
ncbi:MAG TPA: glycerophosphodiester phosphodiesterase family protein [Pyrinomonadaceae bacterium]|jgi:glycerophosphoryl diester phosphodiesterase|nr:glycerophosphodiester phosphodiesterase family protein [Pyrinomonadaceae bacterium]